MKTTKKPNADLVNAKVFNLPVIRCRCGAEILLVPDAAATGKAIEQHIQTCSLTQQQEDHNKCMTDLSDYLIGQVFDRAAEAEEAEYRITRKVR